MPTLRLRAAAMLFRRSMVIILCHRPVAAPQVRAHHLSRDLVRSGLHLALCDGPLNYGSLHGTLSRELDPASPSMCSTTVWLRASVPAPPLSGVEATTTGDTPARPAYGAAANYCMCACISSSPPCIVGESDVHSRGHEKKNSGMLVGA